MRDRLDAGILRQGALGKDKEKVPHSYGLGTEAPDSETQNNYKQCGCVICTICLSLCAPLASFCGRLLATLCSNFVSLTHNYVSLCGLLIFPSLFVAILLVFRVILHLLGNCVFWVVFVVVLCPLRVLLNSSLNNLSLFWFIWGLSI